MAQNEQPKPSFCQRLSEQCSSFGKFLYNSETKQVLGRGGKSWAKIGVFYLVFYGFLAGFFSAMLAVFMTTIEQPADGGKPKLTQFIENQPGLTRVGPSLETYDPSKSSFAYAEKLAEIFQGIKDNTGYKGECPETKGDNVTKPCYAPFSQYGECDPTKNNTDFGMKAGKPCIFIRINKVYGWMPSVSGNYLELSCEGEGKLKQFPKGFLLNGFPFEGGKMELPFVALQVDASGKVEIDCELKGDGIKVSDSYNPARSYGKIRIKDIKAE